LRLGRKIHGFQRPVLLSCFGKWLVVSVGFFVINEDEAWWHMTDYKDLIQILGPVVCALEREFGYWTFAENIISSIRRNLFTNRLFNNLSEAVVQFIFGACGEPTFVVARKVSD